MKKSEVSSLVASTPNTKSAEAAIDSPKTAGSGKVAKSGRQPLTPIQNKTSNNGIMVKPAPAPANDKKLAPKNTAIVKKGQKTPAPASFPSASSIPAPTAAPKASKVGNGPVNKNKKQLKEDKEVQTDGDNHLDWMTSDEAPIEYWKELAEERRTALEEALEENTLLSEKVARLEKENKELEETVEEAKQLAEMLNTISEEHALTADESGIGKDADESTL